MQIVWYVFDTKTVESNSLRNFLKSYKMDNDKDDKRSTDLLNMSIYWRKANMIHNWFYEKCVFLNEPDNKPMLVKTTHLIELLDLCKNILLHKEETLSGKTDYVIEHLPTRSGFFFGSTKYDEDYFIDVEDTVKHLEETINKAEDNELFMYVADY
jgi:hypothetical protein